MYSALATLLDRLDDTRLLQNGVISWGAPVPSFGNVSTSRVATLGLNPSNREFVDEAGDELMGTARRFHTLRSLNLRSWLEADARHVELIADSCRRYFETNPYDRWFRRLDNAISATGSSFYGPNANACHLDLVPYATAAKWTELAGLQRRSLLGQMGDILGLLLRDSGIRLLILNGRSVVEHFEEVTDTTLQTIPMERWTLPRRSGRGVPGIAFRGMVDRLGSVSLGYDLTVLGYNHNLQSSFGVTRKVIAAISRWIGTTSAKALA